MSTVDPYVPAHPGGLITAEAWNEMQRKIQSDIGAQVRKAIDEVKRVDRSGDAEKLGGKTPEELAKEIVTRALGEIPRRTGYRRVFKRLPVGRPGEVEYAEIKHDLKAFPLVDVYQLDYFPVICRADGESGPSWVNFYLYHTSERRIGRPKGVVIQEGGGPGFRLPFFATLAELGVDYQDDDSLEDLVNEFWKKLLPPSRDGYDEFDERHYCHSPWFQRCCSDDRTVADIRRAGDENDLWLKLKPRKTINYPRFLFAGQVERIPQGVPVPPDIEVVHFDLDTAGIRVVPPQGEAAKNLYVNDPRAGVNFTDDTIPPLPQDGLIVMVLLQAGAPAAGASGAGGPVIGGQGPGGGPAAY